VKVDFNSTLILLSKKKKDCTLILILTIKLSIFSNKIYLKLAPKIYCTEHIGIEVEEGDVFLPWLWT
jgi:hypothetical protein